MDITEETEEALMYFFVMNEASKYTEEVFMANWKANMKRRVKPWDAELEFEHFMQESNVFRIYPDQNM